MGFPKISLSGIGQKPAFAANTEAPAPVVVDNITPNDKDIETNANADAASTGSDEKQRPDEDLQRGVRDVQAVALTWSKASLIAVFIMMWLLYLTNGFQSTVIYVVTPFATSSFSSHSLLTVISIVANSISASVYIPLAKMLDIWGRAEGFALMVCSATLGLIILAVSENLATYCAAQIFYSIGFSGLIYSVDVITADSTTLRNRGLAFAFTSSPYMITAFAGSKAAEGFLESVNWRWGIGCWAIVLPIVASPLFFVLKHNLKKAEKRNLVVNESSGRTWSETAWWAVKEFDLLGVFLFASGLVIFLLPFNLADSAPNGWSTGYIIAMIVVGFIVLVFFGVWESCLAPVPFISVRYLLDRTVIGACLLDLTYMIANYCWSAYFSSFLMVVNNVSPSEAGYIGNTFEVVSGVLLFIVGYAIRRTGYFKWLLYIALPIYVLAQGLLIYFRRPNGYIGYIVMCQIFLSVGGSVFILCMQVAILSAVDHQHVAAALALLSAIGNLGVAIGSTISGTIWTNTFGVALERYLPESALEDLPNIFADIEYQLAYEVGSPERIAIQQAYGYAQTRMLSVGTGIMALGFIWIFMFRNINVAKSTQTKGNVF